MNIKILSFLIVAVLTIASTTVSHAATVIDILDARVLSGGRSSVDVLVTSNASELQVTNFQLRFGISAETSGGIFEFQADFDSGEAFRQSDSERFDSNYIFLGNLEAGAFRPDLSGSNLRLLQKDSVSGAATPSTIGAGQSLLARLEIQHISPLPVDGEFEIFLIEGPNTLFLNQFTLVMIDESS